MQRYVEVFWDMTPCILVGGYRHVGEHASCIFYHEDEGGNLVRNVGTSVTDCTALRTREPFTPAFIVRYAQS
jgi:hypothetical protein